MEEAWERAVEAAVAGEAEPRALTLDGAVKCLHGRLPPPTLLERFRALEHLSIANVGVSSLEKFPRLRRLRRLSLSDNRIAGGLEFLVSAGLDALRDLDLSNNRIASLDDLAPLARLRLVSLDLYECPVTRIKDYRSRVFSMIRSLKYLDKMDADENERPESDEEEEDDEEEDDDDEEEDPGSGEVDAEDHRAGKAAVVAENGVGSSSGAAGVVDADEDDESDADEETEGGGRVVAANGSGHLSNGFRVAAAGEGDEDEEDDEEVEDEDDDEDDDDDYDDLGEEIDEEGDDDVVEVHEIEDSEDEDEDGVEEEDEMDEEEEEEEVEDDGDGEPGSTGRAAGLEGEIDGHEQGEEDENGEIGEEDEQGVEDDRDFDDDGDGEDEDEDLGMEYLVQPIAEPEEEAGGSDFDACNEDDESEEEDGVDDEDGCRSNGVAHNPTSSLYSSKRKRDEGGLDDDNVEESRSSKQR